MSDQPLLQIRHLVKKYPGTVAVNIQPGHGVSFAAGSIHALVGENGAGKSTLIGTLGGVVSPDERDILLNGAAFTPKSAPEARDLGIETVRQDSGLVPTLTVAENLFLGRESAFKKAGFLFPAKRRALAAQALAALELHDIRPNQLAGSLDLERQKFVELARALFFNPRVLIVDEMTASLSRRGVQRLFKVLREQAARGVLIIYISHYLEEVFELCDRITVLKDGTVVTTVPSGDVDEDQLSTLMVGRSTRESMFHEDLRPEESSDVVLRVDGAGISGAFEDVSFDLRSGEILGVAGLVGCGSEELGLAVFGARQLDSGSMQLDGASYAPSSPRQAIARGVAHVPSDRDTHGVVLRMPIAENVVLATLRWLSRLGFRAPGQDRRRSRDLIRELGISCRGPRDLPLNLSGGNRQRVVIAKWMVRDNRVLVLHNPTRGVDVGAKAELYRVIRSLSQAGQAILLISDDLQELLGLSDRLIALRRGRISTEFPKDSSPTEELVVSHMI
ncbi:MAG TPA: sugar ABC transporter ATP-binding protein [Micromonosporaceae bacterium]|nr:sugar ABC transporter ATP-binding protein [Micromonosporaceae bacterium]